MCFFTVTLLVTLIYIYRSTVLLSILWHKGVQNSPEKLGNLWNAALEPRRESAGGLTWRRVDGPGTEKQSDLPQEYPTACTRATTRHRVA